MSWAEAYRQTYPEIGEEECKWRLHSLKFRNARFRDWLERRRNPFGGDSNKMPKKELHHRWITIARFNIASLYEKMPDGSVVLVDDWLEQAKSANVIKKIAITKTEDQQGNVTTKIDITPYSADGALYRLGKLYGLEAGDKVPGNVQLVQQNNTYLVKQIDGLRSAIKAKQVPEMIKPDDSGEFVQKMLDARIVKDGEELQDDGAKNEDDQNG